AGVRVLATCGLGGVHRGWTVDQDESADMDTLARTRITVVCADVKSILDVPAALQRLDKPGVTVADYRTHLFHWFYQYSPCRPLEWRIEKPEEAAAVMRGQDAFGGQETALIVANPVHEDQQLDPALHDRVLTEALAAAESQGVTGQAITPFLLDYLVRGTGGASLEANLAAVRGNTALAAEIAAAWSRS